MYYKLALLSILLILPPVVFLFDTQPNSQIEQENVTTSQIEPPALIVEQESVRDMIVRLSLDGKVPTDTALRIADCESKMGTQMENPNSSAKGVYQFIKQTWLYACGGGDVMNNELNVKCFLKLYPEHPEWWECK
jgi:hypothetical protein